MFNLKEIEPNVYEYNNNRYYIPNDSRIIAGIYPLLLLLQDSERKISIHTKNYYIDTRHKIHYNPKFIGPIYDTLCILVPEDLVNMILHFILECTD